MSKKIIVGEVSETTKRIKSRLAQITNWIWENGNRREWEQADGWTPRLTPNDVLAVIEDCDGETEDETIDLAIAAAANQAWLDYYGDCASGEMTWTPEFEENAR